MTFAKVVTGCIVDHSGTVSSSISADDDEILDFLPAILSGVKANPPTPPPTPPKPTPPPLPPGVTDYSGDLQIVGEIYNNTTSSIKYVEINSKKVIQELFISMDTDSIIKAIENGLDVNSKNDKDSNFLHFAVEQDNRALIKFLIDKNININCQDKDGATALLLASQENNYESIKICNLYFFKSIDPYNYIILQ